MPKFAAVLHTLLSFYRVPLASLCLLALLTCTGATVPGQSGLDGFDPNANDLIRVALIQPDGKIIIGGDFTSVSPNGGAAVTRNRIVRLNSDGTLDSAFNPDIDGLVTSLAVQADGKILVGGLFTIAGGQTRNSIARLDAVTGLADSFDPNANSIVWSISVQEDGEILAGGGFTSIGGQVRRRIARLDPMTGLADSFDPNPSGTVLQLLAKPTGRFLWEDSLPVSEARCATASPGSIPRWLRGFIRSERRQLSANNSRSGRRQDPGRRLDPEHRRTAAQPDRAARSNDGPG